MPTDVHCTTPYHVVHGGKRHWLNHTRVSHLLYGLYLLSIPSHYTMGGNGVIQECHICFGLYLLSIPSHCTIGGNGQTRIVPKCPICYTLYLLSIPFHYNMGGNGWTELLPKCPICYTLSLYCPSFPLYQCTNCLFTLFLKHNIINHNIVIQDY